MGCMAYPSDGLKGRVNEWIVHSRQTGNWRRGEEGISHPPQLLSYRIGKVVLCIFPLKGVFAFNGSADAEKG